MTTHDHTACTNPEAKIDVREISVTLETPPGSETPLDLHPESGGVYRRAFAAELVHLPDIRDRLLELAHQAGYDADVETAVSSITDAADEIIDAVEAHDPGALAGD